MNQQRPLWKAFNYPPDTAPLSDAVRRRWRSKPRPSSTVGAFLVDGDQAAVNALALAAFVVAVLVRIPFAGAHEWFPDAGRAASLAADLCVGYLAAWFFYFLVSWRPGYKTRHRVAFMVTRQAFAAMANGSSQLRGAIWTSAGVSPKGPVTREELTQICAQVHIMAPSTDSNILDFSQHPPVISSIWRHITAARTAVEPIIEVGAMFDADIVADAAAIKSAAITSIGQMVDLANLGVLASPGGTLAQLNYEPGLWEFMDLNERLWLTVYDRYPEAAAALGPNIAKDHNEGRGRVLIR